MVSNQLSQVVRQLRRVASRPRTAALSDAQLLEHFASRHDEQAFELLLARHGPMVLALCKRLLRDTHDAEDAFQATFLILVRKAETLSARDLLGNWLYGVAYRIAVRARVTRSRRRAVERAAGDRAARAPAAVPPDQELGWLLHEELSRLPEKYRRPVVLCYLEGMTHEEAARRLHWPVGTVKGRLMRARELLRRRLARQGVTLSSGALAAALSPNAAAALPPPLIVSTVKAALLSAAGGAAAPGGVSASVLALVQGTLRAMWLARLKAVGALMVAMAVLVPGAGWLVDGALTQPAVVMTPDSPPAKKSTITQGKESEVLEATVDLKAKFVEGQPFYQEIKTETKQVIRIMQMEVTQKQSQTSWVRWTPLPLTEADGDFLVKLKVVGFKIDVDAGGSKVHYDSTAKNQPVNALSNFFEMLRGAECTVRLNGDLRPSKYLRPIEWYYPNAFHQTFADDKSVLPLLKKMFGDAAFKERASPLDGVLAGRVVHKSDTWTASARQDRGAIGQYLTHYRYTYLGRVGALDRIKVNTTLDYAPPRADAQAGLPFTILKANMKDREGSGIVEFDRARGRIAHQSLDSRLAGTLLISVDGMNTEVELVQTQRTTLNTTDSNPLK